MSIHDEFDKALNPPPWAREYKPNNAKPKSHGANCVVHSYTWIGDAVEMGDNVKVQAFAFIPNGVLIGSNVFIGPHVCFTNDRVPPSDELTKTVVENGASIGANSTILPGLTIGENALIGAGSVVTKSVPPNEVWVGNPARFLRAR